MRRTLASVLAVASVPVGVAVGLWMALLTRVPPCPVRGLGTAALCAARPVFDTELCVACGGATTALLLLASIAARRPASGVAIFDLAAAETGLLIGLWTSTFVLVAPSCGPGLLCIAVLARFPAWLSALIGAAAMALILVIGAMNPDVRRANLNAARNVLNWLFRDLSQFVAPNGPGADAG